MTYFNAALVLVDVRLDGDGGEAIDVVDIAALVTQQRRERHLDVEGVAAHEAHQQSVNGKQAAVNVHQQPSNSKHVMCMYMYTQCWQACQK